MHALHRRRHLINRSRTCLETESADSCRPKELVLDGAYGLVPAILSYLRMTALRIVRLPAHEVDECICHGEG